MKWEVVIGLEIHAELNTQSKLFSCAPNRFGGEPNTNITEACTGQPGSLPVLNKEAVKKAVQFGCAIQGTIAKSSSFDRKSYFYPDSPRNFQITQFYNPIVLGGKVVAKVQGKEKVFPINRAHLEDDAGTLKHFSNYAGVDYNRAGSPLIEIVSEPCIQSPKEAVAYAMAVRAILQYIDVSNCNMEEGAFRIDANISVRPKGENVLRNKTEVKNLNSFGFMEKAIQSEIDRQIAAYENNPDKLAEEVIPAATYRWDLEKKKAVCMRMKERAQDYRYFPEPDLVPIVLTDAYIEEMARHLPELPLEREKRYVTQLGLSAENAFLLSSDKALSDYFEACLKTCSNARVLCNWLTGEFAGRLKEQVTLPSSGIPPEQISKLVNMLEDGVITGKIAKKIADILVAYPDKDCEWIVAENPDFSPLSDESQIQKLVKKVIHDNPQSVEDYKKGREKAFEYLVGQVMKLSQDKAAPKVVTEVLKRNITL